MRRLLVAASFGAGSFAGPRLLPTATLSITKSGSNPTFSFTGDTGSSSTPYGPAPESVVKVGSTYYAAYAPITTTVLELASASSPAGPWTDLGIILTGGSQAWETSQNLYAPWLMADGGTFYLFYSTVPSAGGGTGGSVGVATATTITGPYTKYASNPILSPGTAGAWDSRRVGEVSVINVGGSWTMAYMGETTAVAYQASEKVGIATASSPYGPWTRAAGNPLVTWGAGGAWDNALCADPSIFYDSGYYWIWYTGGQPSPWKCGLAYATSPTGTWTKYAGNPLLVPGTAGAWDAGASWRGCVFRDGLVYHVIYGGMDSPTTQVRGGNAILNVA